jgi:hypothetical protein
MKVKRINGIDRVLDQVLTSPLPAHYPAAENPADGKKTAPRIPRAYFADDRSVPGRVEARRGRPAGKQTSASSPTEKVTLRISRCLVADYRDWSWDARCHLSHLVERALADYQCRNRPEQRRGP